MASLQHDTDTVKRELDDISTPTQVFIATLIGLGIIAGVLIGLWVAVDPQDEGEPPAVIEWDDNLYELQGGGADAETDG
jgi:hypothetical protein